MYDTTVTLPDGVSQPLDLHFAIQVCDLLSHQNQPRVCGDDRTLLSKKSIKSFLGSLEHCCKQRPLVNIHVCMILDQCSEDLVQYCQRLQQCFAGWDIEIRDLRPNSGLADSIGACYKWMQKQGQHIVGQFQDDYIFYPQALDDVLDVLLELQLSANTDVIVNHFHYSAFWTELYKNQSTPRFIHIARNDYWIQIYDTPCTFVTTHSQFSQHWDLYHLFLDLCVLSEQEKLTGGLESQSLNKMFTQRGILGIAPMRTLSHHVQTTRELDPHQDWKLLWQTISLEI